ncbi:MAG: hypothetical protein NMNS01_25940 [Nitrosomonas sp.]|nr:MAG: hypothetical protein NMNS01_25940 [Nitrosomonas sp.]
MKKDLTTKTNPSHFINGATSITEITHSVSALNDQRPFEISPSDGLPGYIQFTSNGNEHAESGKRWAARNKEKDVITLAGNGCSLQVDKGQLVLRSGYTCSTVPNLERRISRGVHVVRAIIVLNTTGNLSTAAIQWCADQRIALYMLDRDASLTALTHTPTPHVVSLRRLQYSTDSIVLAREILVRKLAACCRTKSELTESIITFVESIKQANSLDTLRLLEARAALTYWSAWNMPIKWKEKSVPTEWKSFTQRASGISGKGYQATHPVNSLLNYAYAILAGQVERALQISGLDVAVGSLHADQDGRASLVFDLMEPLRPVIDQIIFSWASTQRWRRADFVVDRKGVIRLHPQLGRVVVKKAMLPEKTIRAEIDFYIGRLKQLNHQSPKPAA